MNTHQIFMVIFLGMVLLTLVIELIRRRMLREKYALLWVFTAVFFTTVPLLYKSYGKVANILGLNDANAFLLFTAILGLFLLCLQFSLALSAAYRQRKRMSQEMALVEERVSTLEKEVKKRIATYAEDKKIDPCTTN